MMITRSFELATDGEFRLLAGFTSPPRAGVVTGVLPSGQLTVALDETDGGEARAWPLNGWHYPVGAVVYVAFAADSPESGIVLGAKAPMPALDAYVQRNGATPLSADWDIGDGRRLLADELRARDGDGLLLRDDGGTLGLHIADGGQVGIGSAAPAFPFTLEWPNPLTSNTLAAFRGKRNGQVNVEYTHTGAAGVANEMRVQYSLNTTTQKRTALEIAAAFDEITDNMRNSAVRFYTAIAGVFGVALQMTGKRLGLFHAAGNPQGMFHAHDGAGGVIGATVTGVNSTTPRTIIADGTGDVARGIVYQIVVSDGTNANGTSGSLTPGSSQDYPVGTLTLRLTCTAGGALTVYRQSGTGSGSVALLGVWL